MITFKHSGNAGDVILALPTIASIRKRSGRPVRLLLEVGAEVRYYPGAVHPLGHIKLDTAYAGHLVDLLTGQDYLDEVGLYEGQKVDVDLDLFRERGLDLTRGCLARHYFHVFNANWDLSRPWLKVEPNPEFSQCLVCNRTQRYRNLMISYRFLNSYPGIIFLGTDKEYDEFRREVPRSTHYPCKDFKELAGVIAGAKVFVGNQSFCYTLAEAVKVTRVLEICPFAPVAIPHGENGYDFHFQDAFEKIVAGLIYA